MRRVYLGLPQPKNFESFACARRALADCTPTIGSDDGLENCAMPPSGALSNGTTWKITEGAGGIRLWIPASGRASKAHNAASRHGPALVEWLASKLGVSQAEIPRELASFFGIEGVILRLGNYLHGGSHSLSSCCGSISRPAGLCASSSVEDSDAVNDGVSINDGVTNEDSAPEPQTRVVQPLWHMNLHTCA